jgi:UDP-N-acetylmuramate: L-alanyl-gamma-D-glutamyl-meso-diaminopimelate ligase
LQVFTDSKALADFLHAQQWANANLLLMTSGTFDGLDLTKLAAEVVG